MVPPTRRSALGERAFLVAAPRVWNSLPSDVHDAVTLSSSFRQRLPLYHFYSDLALTENCDTSVTFSGHVFRSHCFCLRQYKMPLQRWTRTASPKTLSFLHNITFNSHETSLNSYACYFIRGHPYKLFKERSTNAVRKNFFSQRVVNAWNYLPADTVDFRSLRSFTRTIKLVDFRRF